MTRAIFMGARAPMPVHRPPRGFPSSSLAKTGSGRWADMRAWTNQENELELDAESMAGVSDERADVAAEREAEEARPGAARP